MTFDKFSDMIFSVTKKGSFFCRGLQQQFFYMIKAGKASKSFSLFFRWFVRFSGFAQQVREDIYFFVASWTCPLTPVCGVTIR